MNVTKKINPSLRHWEKAMRSLGIKTCLKEKKIWKFFRRHVEYI